MNQDQIIDAIRSIIAACGGYFVGRGMLTSDQLTLLGGVAGAVVPLIFSFTSRTNKAKVASAQAVPAAQVVVSDPALASADVKVARPGAQVTVTAPAPPASAS